jgi:choline dehydrogenase-like flavoprotein
MIIGAGAAGITLARRLAAAGKAVMLVEGGDLELTRASQELYEGESIGHPYNIRTSRLRYFGGTTNHWSGWTRPLDANNFVARPDMNYPGWDIPFESLTPYLGEALEIIDIPADALWQPQDNDHPFDRAIRDSDFEEVYWHWSTPTVFKEKYLEEIEDNPDITLYLNHSLVDLEFTADGTITSAIFHDLTTGERVTLQARQYVLACGGIENARLLLHINRLHGLDWGGQYLGKHFMEHPHFVRVGHIVILDPNYEHIVGGSRPYRFLKLNNAAVRREGVLDYSVRFREVKDYDPIMEELKQLTYISNSTVWRVADLSLVGEQAPSLTSQIMLDDAATDDLGMPRAKLVWEISDLDYRSAQRAARLFAEFIAKLGMGRCRFDSWIFDAGPRPEPEPGYHHMGTTKMASSPERGVVDTDCRLYGTQNLYVAGSSVFPTVGYANPTLPLIQLALRLADHLSD